MHWAQIQLLATSWTIWLLLAAVVVVANKLPVAVLAGLIM
jgi:hypothetical protein